MLITTCTHCRARFRVSPQQLNASQGQVRCGRCEKVFIGFEVLERFPDDDTGGRLLALREAEEHAEKAAMASADAPAAEALPEIESVDGPPTQPAGDEGSDAPPGDDGDAAAVEGAARAPRLRHFGPGFDLQEPKREPPSRAWLFGVALLAIVLGLELAYAYRGPLAQRYPALRPSMEAICVHLQCSVPWSHDEALLKLEDSELLEVPGKPTEIALGARIRNLAPVSQEFPHLELTLTDLTGQAALRRVLRPADYLGRALNPGEVLAPGVEVALQLRLETPRLKATGYELLLFYP